MGHDGAEWGDADRDRDFELEVSSLDAPQDAPPPNGDAQHEELAFVEPADDSDDLDSLGTQRLTPRRRLLAAASTTLAVVLALVVVLSSAPGGDTALWQRVFPPPSPTATLAPGANSVVLAHSVPWGRLTIDGRRADLPPISISQSGAPYTGLVLARGSHTLDYAAPPFPELRCQVSVPQAQGDTCPLANLALSSSLRGLGAVRMLDLQATPSYLSAAQYAALVQRIEAALIFPPGDVMPGDHYAQQDGTVVAAAQKLQATLLMSLNSGNSRGYSINGEPCDTLCPGTYGPLGVADASAWWGLTANMQAAWQFTDTAGHVVQTTPLGQTTPAMPGPPILIPLQVQWGGGWTVALAFPEVALNGLCEQGIGPFFSMMNQQGPSNQGFGLSSEVGRTVAEGCFLHVVSTPSTPVQPGTPVANSLVGNVLYRYGALIAANDATHRLWPQLPLPSANERSIIAAFPPRQ